jgi:hypothetical protein
MWGWSGRVNRHELLEALKNFVRWIAFWVFVVVLLSQVLSASPLFRDDTDPASRSWGDPRSGIKPAIDALTGCEYLLSPHGGITPRLDVRGQHVGCKS